METLQGFDFTVAFSTQLVCYRELRKKNSLSISPYQNNLIVMFYFCIMFTYKNICLV